MKKCNVRVALHTSAGELGFETVRGVPLDDETVKLAEVLDMAEEASGWLLRDGDSIQIEIKI